MDILNLLILDLPNKGLALVTKHLAFVGVLHICHLKCSTPKGFIIIQDYLLKGWISS